MRSRGRERPYNRPEDLYLPYRPRDRSVLPVLTPEQQLVAEAISQGHRLPFRRRGRRHEDDHHGDDYDSDDDQGIGNQQPDQQQDQQQQQQVQQPQYDPTTGVRVVTLLRDMQQLGIIHEGSNAAAAAAAAAAADDDAERTFDLEIFRTQFELSRRYIGLNEETGSLTRRMMQRLTHQYQTFAYLHYEPALNHDLLYIPRPRCDDLSVSVLLYLLYLLSNTRNGHYFGLVGEGHIFASRQNLGRIQIQNRRVSYDRVMEMFAAIMRRFREAYTADVDAYLVANPGLSPLELWDAYVFRWGSGGEHPDSDEVIIWNGTSLDAEPFRLDVTIMPALLATVGGKWDGVIGDAIQKSFPTGVVCSKNETDPLCLLYAIAMGIVTTEIPNYFSRDRFVDVNVIARRIDALTSPNVGCAKLIMQRIRGRAVDGANGICSYIESIQGQVYNMQQLCDIFQRIEDEVLVPAFALDVYKLEIRDGGTKTIFPAYISKRKSDKRISIVNVSYKGRHHYCLITNYREVMSETGGKTFFTCSKCHRTFYTRHFMLLHDCNEPAVKKWSWSTKEGSEANTEVGKCDKCHLLFEDVERFEFHKRYCFMRQRSGTRYVQLAEKSVLQGGGEEESLEGKYLLFADFESFIRADGEHVMMTYGIFNEREREYHDGEGIENFILYLEGEATFRSEIRVFFHNAMNYDVNFMLQFILEHRKDWGISLIMKTSSRIQTITFTFRNPRNRSKKCKIIIGDTFHFMTMSLNRIVESIRKEDVWENADSFPRFFYFFEQKYHVPYEVINEVLHKNLFPYRYFDSGEKLKNDIEDFKRIFEPDESNLQYFSEGVTVDDLASNLDMFKRIVDVFQMRTVKDYHDLYLRCDVLQIADVFMKARETLFHTHDIDIAKYVGMPSASWAAFLKMNPDMELPLYTETRFAEFFSSMTRGGVTSAPLRYAQCDESHSILYLDVNGLYPYVMQQYKYPMGEMEWKPIQRCDGCNEFLQRYFEYLESNGKGACLCVDMHISDELKERTDQFPFAPEHKILKDCYFDESGEMYPFLKKWSDANNGEKMKPFIGLVGTLYDKQQYGVHWRLLQWYIQHGLEVTYLHFAVEFDEGDYLKSYVKLNIDIRNTRTDELGKMVYKLLGNSIYGKTFESPFNRGTYLIVREKDKLRGILEEGAVSSIIPLEGENFIVKMDADTVVLNKPTYIGACVTEYAKLHMYTLFYDKLASVFPNVELVYTDTDSFIVRVEHRPGMSSRELFAFIEEQQPGLIGKIGGQVKSETGDDTIEEVIALRSKLYAYKTKGGKIGKRAKGTTAAAQETQLSWDTYKEALFYLRAVPTRNVQFERRGFHVRTVEMVKQSISVNDGKRYICEDGIHTHAWGYK